MYGAILAFLSPGNLGKVLYAPLRVKLWDGKFREPDIAVMLAENAHRRGNKYWNGADLAVEIVSDDDPDRDLVEKKAEYARAGIHEYWIVDPRDRTNAVHALEYGADEYRLAGSYRDGETADSALLPGLSVPVSETFAQT